ARLTGGELNTRRADLRWATGLGGDWYMRLVGGYQQSDDFTRSRNQTVEYSRVCVSTSDTNCLRREAVPLAETEAQIGYGGLRFDKHFESGRVLTIEGGTASLEGPTFVTGIGRVQVTDVQRPWTRVNFNTQHWNVLAYYDQRVAEDQVALSSGALLFEDSSNLHGEIQGNTGFAGGRGFLVGGLAYHQQEVDTSNDQGFHTLMAEAKEEDQQAAFGQVEYNLTDKLKAVVAARVDESTLHDTQFSPKASLVYGFTPNHSLRLTYNEAFQVPNYSEFFLRAPAGAITAFAPLEAALAPLLGGRTLGLASIPILARGNSDLEVEEITSYELGYTAIVSRKLFLTLDYYRNEVENFVTDLLPGVNPVFTTPYAPPSFLPAAVQAQILATLRGGLGQNTFPGLTTINGFPALVLSYTNSGVVDTQGIDFTFNYYVNDRWSTDFSYSWFDFEVQEQDQRDQLLPNAPENKVSAGLSYSGGSFDAGIKYRWVDDFPWAAGIFVGEVPSYDLVDLSVGYRFSDNIKVGVDVSNALDEEHFQAFGGDLIERRALGYVTLGW
ncbi:MAG TPA: TonB-dependent receptor, partial [Thermoanaerobaculia bacterium]|nr:TonB-dependent receptor [Thermoanaerobaculia bacterium]